MAKPKILAIASFDKSMVKTLENYFEAYEKNGVVDLEVTDHGLWLVNPNGTRQFLGSVDRFPRDPNVTTH